MENPNPTVDGLQLHSTTISGRSPDEGLLPDRCLPPVGDSLLTLEHTDSGSELRNRTAKDSSMAICTAKFPCTTLEGQATNSDKEHLAGGDQFVFPPVMERPASPTPLESQRVDECGMAGKESVGNCNASYAAAVQGTSNMGAGNSRGLLGEDILVFEEDVLIDRSRVVPSIKFSERIHALIDARMGTTVIVLLLGKNISFRTLHARIPALWSLKGSFQLVDLDINFLVREWCGKGVHNAGTEVNNEKVIDSSKDSVPFDPWMVASHKNRHPRKEIGKQRDDGDEHGPSKSSTFHVLQDLDEEIDLEHRVEVLDSARLEGKRPTSHVKDKQPIHALSEPRHSSAPFHVVVQPGSASSTVAGSSNERRASLEHNQVDPLVVGKSVQDVAVRNITQGGNHKATLIVEEGQDLRMHAGGDIVNVSGGKSKRKMDVSSKGLRIQKRSEFKIPTKPTLAEWMSLVPEKPVRSSVRDVPTTKLDPGLEPPIVKQSVAGSSLSLVSDPVIDISLATDCDMQV
ncbi:hypothetical protein V6N12_017427 [Hibiscus sabdariffa]|uniref:Uncharacterized protein n=1 Tax=Hibiscus sabdariffa TaxID=183260 RepID=A0ABR2CFI7_9ROSI